MTNQQCSAEGCERPLGIRGLCNMHYKRARLEENASSGRLCALEGCNRPLVARRLCSMHYNRARLEEIASSGRLCALEGCNRPLRARGLCGAHYHRARAHGGDPGPADRLPPIDHDAFSRSCSSSTWYWVGFLAADGCVTDTGDIYLRLAKRDLDHIQELRAFVGAGRVGSNTAGRICGPHKGCFCLMFRSPSIAADLHRLGGITPRKSLTYTPTTRAAAEPAFWLGMLDGDGTAYWHKDNRWRTTPKPELIWIGTRAAMTKCAAFWSDQLPAASVVEPRLARGHLWELRLSSHAAVPAAEILLGACGYSLTRKRSKLGEIARYALPTPTRLVRSCTWCGTDVKRYPSQATTPHSFCSHEHYVLWQRAVSCTA